MRQRVVPKPISTDAMAVSSETESSSTDPIHQLESDLKRAVSEPLRFPRTNKLRSAGAPQQAKKMIEEAAELAIEAVRGERAAAVSEAADLVYNLVVLLDGIGLCFDDVRDELTRRRRLYGIAARQQKNGAPPNAA
jgi:phosphoribosyl-ATP pyrophosphohydrolase